MVTEFVSAFAHGFNERTISVRLKNTAKIYLHIWAGLEVRHGQRNDSLAFVDDLDYDPDPDVFKGFFTL